MAVAVAECPGSISRHLQPQVGGPASSTEHWMIYTFILLLHSTKLWYVHFTLYYTLTNVVCTLDTVTVQYYTVDTVVYTLDTVL